MGQNPAFTYSYFPTTAVGMIRNLIGDVGPSPNFILADDEINGMLAMVNGDFFQTAAIACRRIGANNISLAVIRKAGNFSQDLTSISDNYFKLADKYDELAQNVPADAQVEIIATDFNYNQMLTDWVHRGKPFDSF